MRWVTSGAVSLLFVLGCGADDGPVDGDPECEAVFRPEPCPGRGVYGEPLSVAIGTSAPGQVVHYTLDGSEPTAESPIWSGEPIEIAPDTARGGVRTLRLVGVSGGELTPVSTHTYVFAGAVLDQPADPAGLPATWGIGDNVRPADYAMDRSALGDAAAEAIAAFSDHPSIAITTSDADFWDIGVGIYMHPDNLGDEWERPMTVELLAGDNPGFQIVAGVKIQGNSSTRQWRSAKLSLRLAFRGDYGAGDLRFPLFSGSPVVKFDNLILDAHYNNTWHHADPVEQARAQYVRDQFVARLQNEVGSLAPRSLAVHLFLNGIYWGLYDLHERPDEHFAASHLGGAAGDWDVIRHGPNEIVSGSNADYLDLLTMVRGADFTDDAEVDAISALVDIDELIDYMLINFYAGNADWDIHNWFAIRRRTGAAGFRFVSWDAEHVLENVDQNSTAVFNAGAPSEIYQALLANAGFRAQLDARASELYAPGGLLSPEVAGAVYAEMTETLRGAILCESARWGDNRREGDPYLRADWDAERAALLDSYFPARSSIARAQLPAP